MCLNCRVFQSSKKCLCPTGASQMANAPFHYFTTLPNSNQTICPSKWNCWECSFFESNRQKQLQNLWNKCLYGKFFSFSLFWCLFHSFAVWCVFSHRFYMFWHGISSVENRLYSGFATHLWKATLKICAAFMELIPVLVHFKTIPIYNMEIR